VKYEKHHAHLITEVVAQADRLLRLIVLESGRVQYNLVQAFLVFLNGEVLSWATLLFTQNHQL
jgi:hypothetical protein